MSRLRIVFLLIALPLLAFAQTITKDTLSGVVKGTTQPNRTYVVRDSLVVNVGDTLRISAGNTLIMASPNGWIHILGSFFCEGTKTNPNLITVPPARRTGPGQWGGIWGDSCKLVSVKWTTILWAGGNDLSGHSYRTFDIYSDYQNTTQTIFTDNTVIGTVDDCIGLHGGNASVLRNTIKWCGAPDGDNINIKDGTQGEIAYNVIWGSGGNAIKLNANPALLRLTNMCIHNNTIVAGGWRRVGELGYAILVDKSSRAQIYNNIMGDMYQELQVTSKADTLRTVYDNNLFYYSVDSLKGVARYYPSDGVTHAATRDIRDVKASALFASYNPYFSTDWFALDGQNDYRLMAGSAALGKGFTPPAPTPTNYWYNPFFGNTVQLPGDPNIGAMGVYNTSATTGVKLETTIPSGFVLQQNYPNPFNPSTTIRYSLPQEGQTSLKIYNALGQLVETLVDQVQTAGTYNVRFDASRLTSGMFVYRLQSGSQISVGRMMLLK